MNTEKKKVSEAQKRAAKKYASKTKNVSIKFSPLKMHIYDKLMKYTDETGKSVNSFITELLEKFFENEETVFQNVLTEPVLPSFDDKYRLYNTASVSDECISMLNEIFDSSIVEKILSEFYDCYNSYLEEVCENMETKFEKWVEYIFDDLQEYDEEIQKIIVRRCCNEQDVIQYLEKDLEKLLYDMWLSINPDTPDM